MFVVAYKDVMSEPILVSDKTATAVTDQHPQDSSLLVLYVVYENGQHTSLVIARDTKVVCIDGSGNKYFLHGPKSASADNPDPPVKSGNPYPFDCFDPYKYT